MPTTWASCGQATSSSWRLPNDLHARPATPFVADFVGLTNCVQATVESGLAILLGTSIPLLPGSVQAGPALVLIRPESIAVTADPAGHTTGVAARLLGSTGSLQAVTESGATILAQIDPDAMATFSPALAVTLAEVAADPDAKSGRPCLNLPVRRPTIRTSSRPGGLLPHVARVPKGERTWLRPHQQTMRAWIDADPPDQCAGRRVEDVDLTVVPAREPQLRAIGAHPTHVR